MNFLNVSSGKKIEVLNEYEFEIGIKFVYQVVTSDDVFVWKNEKNDFLEIDWDFENERNWSSFNRFFDKDKKKVFDVNNPSQHCISIQPEKLFYHKIENKKIKRYEEKLYYFIKEKIESERLNNDKTNLTENFFQPYQTNWNRKFSKEIKNNLLFLLESFKYRVKETGGEENKIKDFIQQSLIDLKEFKNKISGQIDGNKCIYGIPLNFKFDRYHNIWEEIKETEIFQVFTDDVEFLLSVKVFPYPNNFCSVWVFLGYLLDK